jgi:hypothetical protein
LDVGEEHSQGVDLAVLRVQNVLSLASKARLAPTAPPLFLRGRTTMHHASAARPRPPSPAGDFLFILDTTLFL